MIRRSRIAGRDRLSGVFSCFLSLLISLGLVLGFLPFDQLKKDSVEQNDNGRFIDRAYADELTSVLVHSIALSTNDSTVTYVDKLTVASDQFTGDHKYFMYFHMSLGSDTATARANYQIKYGGTIKFTGTLEPCDATANNATQVSWIDVYTQPATPVAITVGFKSGTAGAIAATANATFTAIDLSDKLIENYDYYYNENTSAAQHTTDFTSKASITLNNADGVKDWMVWAMEDLTVDSTNVNAEAQIYDGAAGHMSRSQEGEDNIEHYTFVLYRAFDDTARGTTYSIQVRDDTDAANDHTKSRIFAFNLNVFDSHLTHWSSVGVNLGNTFTEITTLSYQPAVTGNQIVYASYLNDVAAADTQSDDRLTLDSTTPMPTGWTWTSGGGGKTSYDTTERTISNIANVVSMTSTSSHDIDLDAKEIAGVDQLVRGRGIAVFSTLFNYMPRSNNWRWYADEEDTTPGTAYAVENTAPPQIEMGKSIGFKLRINLTEVGGQAENNNRKKLQYATSTTGPWTLVGETTDIDKLFRYYDGGGVADALVNASTLLTGTTARGIHNESNSNSPSNSDHAANAVVEHEYTIENYDAAANTTYYFSLKDQTVGLITLASGKSFPSLTTASSYSLTTTAPPSVYLGSWQIGSSEYHSYTFNSLASGEEINMRDNRGQIAGSSSGWSLSADITTELIYTVSTAYCSSVSFTGSGTDDMSADCSAFNGSVDTDYKIEIDSHYDAAASFTMSGLFVRINSPGHGIELGSFQAIEVTNTTNYNGTYTENDNLIYIDANNVDITIPYVSDETGTIEYNPNTFKWSDDGGSTWDGTGYLIVPLIGLPLNNGVTVTFTNALGHQTGDYWTFTAYPGEVYTIPKSDMYWITNPITGLYDAPTTNMSGNSGEYMSSAVTAVLVSGNAKDGLGGFSILPTLRIYNASTPGDYIGGVITFTLA